jgi:6-phosphogluconolactonase
MSQSELRIPARDNLHRIVVDDPTAVARAAAERTIARIDANPGRIAICLTGGSSPTALYRLLATEAYSRRIPWNRVHWFIGDERFVAAGDPRNNMEMARLILLDRFAPLANIHPIPTDTSGPEESASRYERELQSFYGASKLDRVRPLFDLVLMGVGPDGHTASLFPGDPAVEETRRWVVDVPKAGYQPFVARVTLTLPTLCSCSEMLFEVAGKAKHDILMRLAAGENLPANRARSIGETVLLVDKAALGGERSVNIASRQRPCALIVMGVSGSGKSTVASSLARRLGWTFEDGDRFHPASNVAKMRAGHPLTDEDRWPWLQAIATEIDNVCRSNGHVVIACSALKRSYRDLLVHGRDDIRIVFLEGTQALIAERLARRKNHFMPPGLLDSQFKTLEPPEADENALTVSIDATVEAIVDDIIRQLGPELFRGSIR